MVGGVFHFQGLVFTYLGKDKAAAKAHWQPFPLPPRPTKGQGKHKGKQEGKGHRIHDKDDEARKPQDKDTGNRFKDWLA
eukprot:15958880-Heterocapsa_arctica.AAC.1